MYLGRVPDIVVVCWASLKCFFINNLVYRYCLSVCYSNKGSFAQANIGQRPSLPNRQVVINILISMSAEKLESKFNL